MNTTPRRPRRRGSRALGAAIGQALQWRMLLLWLLATLVPALLAAMPIWGAVQAQFGHSLHADAIAAGRNVPLLIQGLMKVSEFAGPLGAGLLSALVLTLLVSPFLSGMVVAALRATRRLGFAELIAGGVAQYWRMLRMMLWSVIPLGIAIFIGAAAMGAADKSTADAVLSAEVDHASRIALVVALVAFVLLHASVEAGRGWIGADGTLRSVIRAWWRGLKLLVRRPLATLGVYLGSLVLGLGLALLFTWLRLETGGVGTGAFVLGFLLAQCTALALAWGRITRLYGLADLAADARARRA